MTRHDDAWNLDAALSWALYHAPKDGHHGSAHPTGQTFEYRPAICPGCARAVLWQERQRLAVLLGRSEGPRRPGNV